MAQAYTFPNHIKGDTFPGLQFIVIVNAAPLNLTGASIKAKFNAEGGFETHTLTVGSGITISDAPNGKFQINKQIINWGIDIYDYDISITLSNGEVYSYVNGTFAILKDIANG